MSFHGCCENIENKCEKCGFCFGDCEICCKIPEINKNFDFKKLWIIAERFNFKLEGRGLSPKLYFQRYNYAAPRIFKIKAPFDYIEDRLYKVSYTVYVDNLPKYIYVLVPVWFETVINKLEEDESFFHRWFYFLYQ